MPARKKRTEGRAIVRSRERLPEGRELRADHYLFLRLQRESRRHAQSLSKYWKTGRLFDRCFVLEWARSSSDAVGHT